MQTESKNSVVTLIKNVSEIHKDVQNKSISIAITKIEYQLLIKELWEMDEFLIEVEKTMLNYEKDTNEGAPHDKEALMEELERSVDKYIKNN